MSYPLAPRSYCGGADPAGVGTSELTEMFLRLKQDYPYQPSPDVRNPYTGDPIDSEARYDEFLRELAYRMVCSRTLARNISPNMIRGMYEDELRRAAAARNAEACGWKARAAGTSSSPASTPADTPD